MNDRIAPYELRISDTDLDALRTRLRGTRWPDDDPDYGWGGGLPLHYARELAAHWADGFDWRAQEARLNAHPNFIAEIDGAQLHFVHARSNRPDAVPLLLLHGWPGAPLEFLPLVEPLTAPAVDEAAFEVVIPTLPGFGIPGPVVGWNADRAAAALLELMTRLGHERFVVHGYDTGSLVGRAMAVTAPERLIGLHVTSLFGEELTPENADFSVPAEARAVEDGMRYEMELGGYALVQANRPQSLGLALHDSPVGLMAWLVERFHDWSAGDDAADPPFARDEMLAIVTLYWCFGTAASSMRYYKEGIGAWGEAPAPSTTPTAVLVMPDDLGTTVRRCVEPTNRIVRWTEAARGGHFAAWEEPALVVDDLRAAMRDFAGA